MKRIFFITGTDTGVGKTVLTALLAGDLRRRGLPVAALKPVSSGGRADARVLQTVLDGMLTLDEINPWHFRAPVAPLLAARREHRRVNMADVVAHVRSTQTRFDPVLVEGAGGLLSPLGDDFDSRDLLSVLRAIPLVVASDRLGAVNHVRLTLAVLPRAAAARTRVLFMAPPKPDASSGTNAELLGKFFDRKRIFRLPWMGRKPATEKNLADPRVRRVLRALTAM